MASTSTSLLLVVALAALLPACTDAMTTGTGGAAGSGGGGGDGGHGAGGAAEACGSTSSAFAVCGAIQGAVPPDGSRVYAIWTVEPNGYKFGEGTTSGNRYVLEFSGPPPSAALFEGLLGVAIIVVLPAGFEDIPDGALDDFDALSDAWAGLAVRDVIIYRGSTSLVDWDSSFPANEFSCGTCVTVQGGLDEFEPFDCDLGVDVEGATSPAELVFRCDFT